MKQGKHSHDIVTDPDRTGGNSFSGRGYTVNCREAGCPGNRALAKSWESAINWHDQLVSRNEIGEHHPEYNTGICADCNWPTHCGMAHGSGHDHLEAAKHCTARTLAAQRD